MDTNIIKLSLISLLNFLVIGLIAPVMAPRLLEIGASRTVIGTIDAFSAGLLVLTGPVVGGWSDLQGRKYVVFVISTIAAICYLLLGLTTSLAAVFLLRIILGMVEHVPILNKAIIGDIIPQKNHSTAYSSTGVTLSVGIIIGPIISGHLVERNHGFFYVCSLIAATYIAVIGITQTFPEKKKTTPKGTEPKSLKKEFMKIFVELSKVDWKRFGELLFLRFALSLSIILYFTNQTMYLQAKYDLPQKSVGYIISLFGALGIVATISTPYLRTNFYKNDLNLSKFMLHQYVIMTASFLGLYLVSNLNIFIMFLIPLAFSNTALNLVTMEVILNRATNDDRGSLTGVSESVFGIGRFVAPLAAGIVANYFGERNVLFFAFLTSMSGVIICFKLFFVEKKDIKKK